jgi:hypothetical protein
MMKMQLRPDSEHSFWNLSGISWDTLKCGSPPQHNDPWVTWQGRTWLRKLNDRSICEIVGYQIAEAFGLPLQPWAAFYQTQVSEKYAPKRGIGILVERWEPFHQQRKLSAPSKTHPEQVGRALALAVLDRYEYPEWLINEDKSDLRLIDLEGVGPFLNWPPGRTPIKDYRASTRHFLNYAREEALEAGVHQLFMNHLEILKMLDFPHIVDLSGHPRCDVMERVILRAIEARQRKLRSILGRGEGGLKY